MKQTNADSEEIVKMFEGQSIRVMERLTLDDGTLLVQSSFGSITYWINRYSGNTPTNVETGSLTVSDVIFNTAQLDAAWPDPVAGYNFMKRFAATNLIAVSGAKTTYRLKVRGQLSNGTRFWITKLAIQVLPLLTGSET